MRRLKALAVMLAVMVYVGGTSQVFALTINVAVNGTTVACPTSSSPCNTWFDMSTAALPNGTKFTITSVDPNDPNKKARITATDGDVETLRLENTIFTATATFSGNTILFYATFDTPLKTIAGNVINFWRNAQGAFMRGGGAPTNATFTANGRANGETIVQPTVKTVLCPSSTCGQFALQTGPLSFWEPEHPLNNAHEIRGEILNFKLPQIGDKMQLDEFKVWSITGAGADLSSSGVKGAADCPKKRFKKQLCPR